ncbi:hypothetical protein [Paramylibacter ulvae]|uniref:hypothetical protein n=1 Tax=Paramylibacter ulvae TaxID=1651968 RepID=UPI001673B195|nr:hypothetical protein [Amylibacter ulvae]
MNNLQKSEIVVSSILANLLENGIQDGFLDFNHLGTDDTLEPFFYPCMIWLISEGIIRCSNEHQVFQDTPAINPVLTAYGFHVLGQKFLADGTTVGFAVQQINKGEINFAGIGEVFGGVLGGFTKSLGS